MTTLLYLRDWYWRPPAELQSIGFRCVVPHPVSDAPPVAVSGRVDLVDFGFTSIRLESAWALSAPQIAHLPWSSLILKNALDDARDRDWAPLAEAAS